MYSVTEGTLTRVTNLFKTKKSRKFSVIKMISNSWNKTEGESISHIMEIRIEGKGFQAFTFTFG